MATKKPESQGVVVYRYIFVKGIPNSIVMSETAVKEWEREYELQFSIQFKF